MTMHVTILMGPSGAGKSSFVHTLAPARVVSADKYPGLYSYEGGEVHMNFSLLRKAHESCFRDYLRSLAEGHPVIVDNTNTRLEEISPYILAARTMGYEPSIVGILARDTSDEELASRNKHGVPLKAIQRQRKSLRASLARWPSFWPEVEEY